MNNANNAKRFYSDLADAIERADAERWEKDLDALEALGHQLVDAGEVNMADESEWPLN